MKVLLSPTDRSYKVQFIEFKELNITNILEHFKHPVEIVKLINTGSIPVIPLPAFTKVVKENGYTNAYTLTIEGKYSLSSLLNDKYK